MPDRFVAWLDRRLASLIAAGLAGVYLLLAAALAVVLTGCGADPDLYDQSPATTGHRCGELGDDIDCEGE